MDKRDLCELLSALDRELRSSIELLIVGGAAMILEYGADRATRDVDAILRSGDTQEFRRAVRIVGARHDLPEDWVSDAVKGFADILPPDYAERTRSLGLGGSRLHLVVAGLPELVAIRSSLCGNRTFVTSTCCCPK